MIKIKTAAAGREASLGKALRDNVPRSVHAAWVPAPDRADPVELLNSVVAARLPELIPLRNERMSKSPFAFYRGSAAIMAADLAQTPRTGFDVQACGDAHCLNFGGFATPEQNIVFEVNDFDETLRAPWEWDVKRLATSIILAGRHNAHGSGETSLAALDCVRAYRVRMREFAIAPALEVWYSRLDAKQILEAAKNAEEKRRRNVVTIESGMSALRVALEKLTERDGDRWRFKENPPLLFHSPQTEQPGFDIREILIAYKTTLSNDVAHLLERYTLADCAIKVVGVGSVGTRCGIALLVADENDALLLQVKEATASALEPFAGDSPYPNHGQRVVHGQRLMQSAADIFLGWAACGDRHFYVRQYKDTNASAELDGAVPLELRQYARYCGWALAGAHARSGSAAAISGYLGRNDTFDRAILEFARLYAKQNLSDYQRFVAAVQTDGSIATTKVA